MEKTMAKVVIDSARYKEYCDKNDKINAKLELIYGQIAELTRQLKWRRKMRRAIEKKYGHGISYYYTGGGGGAR